MTTKYRTLTIMGEILTRPPCLHLRTLIEKTANFDFKHPKTYI